MTTATDNERIRSQYPAPIAAAFWQVTRLPDKGPEIFNKHARLIILFEIILKYTSAVVLSYYRQRMDEVEQVEKLLGRRPFKPTLGNWRELQRTLTEVYEHDEKADPLVRTLCRALARRVHDPERLKLANRLAELRPNSERFGENSHLSYGDICDRLAIKYRNWLIHGPGSFLKQSQREHHVPIFQALLTQMLIDLGCLAQFPLIYVKEITLQANQQERAQITICMGTSQGWDPTSIVTQKDLSTGHCYVCSRTEGGQLQPALDLHPFVVHTPCKDDDMEDKFFVFSEGSDKDVEYISYECGHSFSPDESDDLRLRDVMQKLLVRERWAEHLVERAQQRYGMQLQGYLVMLKRKEGQPGYVEEYKQVEQAFMQGDAFNLPRPVVQRIFGLHGISPPGEDPLAVESFVVAPSSIAPGARATLEWKTRGAARVFLEPGVGDVEAGGRIEVSPDQTTTYTLHAHDRAGRCQSKSVAVRVSAPADEAEPEPTEQPPLIEWLKATPERVERGEAAVLRWSTQKAERVTLDPAAGEVGAEGQLEVRPAETTLYTLRAFNRAGEQQSESVGVEVFTPAPVAARGSLEQMWEARLNEPAVKLLRSPETGLVLAVGESGAMFLLGKDGREVWRASSSVPLRGVAFADGGRQLLAADWNGAVRCYDERSDSPLWEAQVPGVVSALAAGQWRGARGAFVGTWRQGLFFCDADGQVQTVSKTDTTISALAAFPHHDGCAAGEWEGGVSIFNADGERPRRVLLKQPVRGLGSLAAAGRVLVVTPRNSFYALDEKGEVLWLYESPSPVISWACAPKAGKFVYGTEGGQHYAIHFAGDGRQTIEEHVLRAPEGVPHDRLAVDDEGDYLAARDTGGGLALYAGETLCQRVDDSAPVGEFHLDPYGFTLLVASDKSVRAYRNLHKLASSRPAKLRAALTPRGAFATGRSTIVELQLSNVGGRPATDVRGQLKGRFAQPVTFAVEQMLPGEVVRLRRDVEPQIGGEFTVSAELSYRDDDEPRAEQLDNLFTVESQG